MSNNIFVLGQMTEEDWRLVVNFNSPSDRKRIGADDMCKELMLKVQGMREYANVPIIIHCGYELSGHSPDSQHYKKKALDLHMVGLSLADQFLIATRFNFGGLGAYPYWNSPGLHVDTRIIPPGKKANRWWRDKDGSYKSIRPSDVLSWMKVGG